MVLVLGESEEQSLVAATDSANTLLTSVERIDVLYKQGLRFEAAVSQMAVVEALLLFYLFARIQADGVIIKEDIKTLRKQKKLTFGKVKSIIIENCLLQDKTIEEDIKAYVSHRNDLAHSLIGTFSSIDLERFYSMGMKLTTYLHGQLLKVVKHHAG